VVQALKSLWEVWGAPTAAPQFDIERAGANSTSLSFYWSPPPPHQWNGRIRYYRINVTDETTNTHTLFRAYSTQWAISTLHPYTRYLCGVAAVTVDPGPSAFITIWTNESAPTATPQNVNGRATGSSSLSLYWSPPPSQHQNGRIRYYHINVTDEATNILASFKTPNTRWTVSSLHPYTRYHCGVAAVTVAQGPSAFITIQTNQSGTSLVQYKFPSDCFRCNGNLLLKYNFIFYS